MPEVTAGGEAVEQQAGDGFALRHDWLGDRGEVEQVGHLVVVEPDDRDVIGHAQPGEAQRADRAEGHLVGLREDRGWLPVTAEQLRHRLMASGGGEVTGRLQPGIEVNPNRREYVDVGLPTVARRGETHRHVGTAGDQRDVAVTEVGQVSDRGGGAGQVVDAHAGERLDRRAEHSHGNPQRA